jgi:hypothetical protein
LGARQQLRSVKQEPLFRPVREFLADDYPSHTNDDTEYLRPAEYRCMVHEKARAALGTSKLLSSPKGALAAALLKP